MSPLVRTETPPDSAYSLWYYPGINRFTDEDGHLFHDLHDLFHMWEIEQWKKTRCYGLIQDKKGDLVELYYLEPEEEEHILTHAFLFTNEEGGF